MSATTGVRQAGTVAVDRHAAYNKSRLFLVSSIALIAAGMANALRTDTSTALKSVFFDPIDPAHAAAKIAGVLAVPFLGFACTIAICSPLLDYISMGLFLRLAALFVGGGTVLMAYANVVSTGAAAGDTLWYGALIAGIGWGLVETVINPLIATLYPDEKTGRLNALHAWWPGGLVIGGLLGVWLSSLGISWQIKLALVAVPAIVAIVLSFGLAFPPTERQAAGISAGEMFRELLNPMFFVLFCSMFLTAASELAPGAWVQVALTQTVHMPGILLLVYVSALMFAMRHFAGPLVHKLSAIGLLWVSCLLASIGLVALSFANSPITGLLAATIWGTGVCYMWPTMLATASERFPRGGALLMGLMGTAGMLSIQFVLPRIGAIYDAKTAEAVGGSAAVATLQATVDAGGAGAAAAQTMLDQAHAFAAQVSFRDFAICPAVLLIVFGIIWLRDRSAGGFKGEKIS
jgi:MFS family permease